LVIVWACKHFMMYWLGIEFELITDHRPLAYFILISPSSKLVLRVERCSFRFTVKYT